MSVRRNGAPFLSARFLVSSCLSIVCVSWGGVVSSVLSVVSLWRCGLAVRSSVLFVGSSGVSGLLRLVGRLVSRIVGASRFLIVFVASSVIAHREGMSRRHRDGRLVKAMGLPRCFFSFVPSHRIGVSFVGPSHLAVSRFVSLVVSSGQGVRRGALSIFIFIRAVFVSSVSRRFLIAIVKRGWRRTAFHMGPQETDGKRHADGCDDETPRAEAMRRGAMAGGNRSKIRRQSKATRLRTKQVRRTTTQRRRQPARDKQIGHNQMRRKGDTRRNDETQGRDARARR